MHPESPLETLADTPATPDQIAPEGITHPPYAFIALLALAGAVLVIALLGSTIARGSQFDFDSAIMLGLRIPGDLATPVGPVWLRQAMIDVTALGGGTVLTIVVVLTIGYLLAGRHFLTAALVFGGTVSGSNAVALGKRLVARERPALVDHLVEVSSASFPSGHASNSAIIYLTIALTVMQIVPSRAARWYLFGATIALVTLIGVSRVYLGVHWPSDVLAGWSAGALWALAWWALGSWLRLRLRLRLARR
ncbi:phosphatase PAP2 family protein [Sphingomonas radiodurans]|uniref:phosphatase PAP2 family protein n=1 Tax=Sphingomonas radiodurans TaxID=2890321 RepID=UPI001E4C6471|nr:phosphatase PAP2 family protein [Sphingomonas radiodurans]WBH15627.1 phosphatase PAP2 family protein [Sphingomonas radiodurans]